MPYKLLDYNKSNPEPVISPPRVSPSRTNTICDKPHLMFLVHERSDSIGGVQRHSARLKDGLSYKYEIERFNWKGPKNNLPLNFPGLYLKARRNDYGFIYCDDGVSAIVGTKVCKPLGKKIMATVHGLDIIVPLPGYQPIITKALKRLDKVVCVSRATADQAIRHGVEPSRVRIIPNTAEYVPEVTVKNESLYERIEVQTGIDLRDKKVLFSLGRPLKRKGFDRFIEKVFRYLPEDYVYIAAGPLPSKPAWIKTAGFLLGAEVKRKIELALGVYTVHDELLKLSNHPRVFYLNGVSEYLRNLLFAASDLFVMPNRTVEGDMEGFGIVALEAAVRGVPVIATGIEGITDAVIDGRNGYCVPEGDDTGMAETIKSLIDKPERLAELGATAREFTRKRFSIDSIVGKYEKLFEDILRNGHDAAH